MAPLSAKQLFHLVTTAAALDREINEKTKQLKTLKGQLIDVAGAQLDRESKARVGQTLTIEGADVYAQIAFPNPQLVSVVRYVNGKPYATINKQLAQLKVDPKGLAGVYFNKLFATQYKPADGFRTLAGAVLGKSGERLINALEIPSSPRCAFKTKDHE